MEMIARFVRRARYWVGARRHAADLAAELEDHRARTQAALEADGIPPAEAAARSRRAMGNVTLAREDARHVWIAALIERIWCDARYGARALRREPSFSVTALITLTLGIFTATTVFTIADAELWKPLPFSEPERLVHVQSHKPGPTGEGERISGPDFLDWQAQSRLAEYSAHIDSGRRVMRRGMAESVRVQPVTANYFTVLDHAPRLGRAFDPALDEQARVAVVSHRGWERLFDSDPGILGQVLTLDGTDFTIVGVNAGQHLGMGPEPDLFVVLERAALTNGDRLARTLNVGGRLRPGVTLAQAQAELQTITTRIADLYPEDHAGHWIELSDLRRAYLGYNWRPLSLFLGAAALVLLLSCLNVANLLLARALRRQREFAIRGALGGGRAALIRQLVVEGAVLAVPSAAVAAVLTAWALRVFATQIPEAYLRRGGPLVLDTRITLFVIGVAAVTTILLSLAPLFFARRIDLNVTLAQGARTGRSPRQLRARNTLLVAQLTLTLVLITAAGLFLRSFQQLVNAPLGFEPHNRVSVRVTLSGPHYRGDAAIRDFAARLLERARAIPGVQHATIDTASPLDSGPTIRLVAAEGPRPAPGSESTALVRAVTSDYFRTLGMTLVTGRSFLESETAGAARVAIINEYLAGRLFPGQNAVGKLLELVPGARTPWTRRPGVVEIVGVAPNVKNVGINEVEFGNIYLPFDQMPATGIEVVVLSALPATQVIDGLRRAVADVDPVLPTTRSQTLTARVDAALRGDRFNLLLIGSFAIIAMVLATVGIYGAMVCAVRERTREFGVRLALGQPPASLVRQTIWEAARFGVAGSVVGLAVVLIAARLIGDGLYLIRGQHEGVLYGVTTTDPVAIAAAIGTLIVIATISGVVPAREATRVDPLVALRQE
jgi:putative ABC transport system permease protein